MKKIALLTVALLVLFGCAKNVEYPPEPVIDFVQIIVKDTTEATELANKVVDYQLYIKVLDGDADLGLAAGDSLVFSADSATTNNLFIYLIKVENGQEDTIDLPIPLFYTIPEFEYVSIYNYFKALIIVDIYFSQDILAQFLDTLKFKFFVVDRQKHMSNIEQTPPIPIDFRGVIVDTVVRIE